MFITPRRTTSGDTVLDASRITSDNCVQLWRQSRKNPDKINLVKGFQRALSAHLTASDGRQPFLPEEEEAVLRELRKHKHHRVGSSSGMQFRGEGFNERQRRAASPRIPATTFDLTTATPTVSPPTRYAHLSPPQTSPSPTWCDAFVDDARGLLLPKHATTTTWNTIASLARMYMLVNKGWCRHQSSGGGGDLSRYARGAIEPYRRRFPGHTLLVVDLAASDVESSVLTCSTHDGLAKLCALVDYYCTCVGADEQVAVMRVLENAVYNSGEEFEFTAVHRNGNVKVTVSVFSPQRLMVVRI